TSADAVLTVVQGVATVSLSSLNQTYDGSAKSAGVTTSPSGLSVDVTYDGSPDAPTNAGSYAVVAIINDANYYGTNTGTLVINKATPTINIAGLSQTFDGTPKPVSVTTVPPGLPVSVTYDGSASPPANKRSYQIIASVNESNYAATVTNTLVISCATITLNPTPLTNGVLAKGYRLACSWATSEMNSPRIGHTATLLPSGKVLVSGGFDGTNTLASAELYNPTTGTWTTTGSMIDARSGHTAVLLPSGKVLVAGGFGGFGTCELYDPSSGTWTTTGSLNTGRQEHTMTLLQDGRVLIAGGDSDGFGILESIEAYNPQSGVWQNIGSMTTNRLDHTATLMPNGKVLIAGGIGGQLSYFLSTAEVIDTISNTSQATGSFTDAREFHAATLLYNGKVMIAGGQGLQAPLHSAELYDIATGTWSSCPPMNVVCAFGTKLITLSDGKALAVGPVSLDNMNVTEFSSEIYDPQTQTWTTSCAFGWEPTLTTLPSGKVLVAGGATLSGQDESKIGGEFTPPSLLASGGTAPYTYSVTAGALPTGISLNSNGSLEGTAFSKGTYSWTVTATDANGCTGSAVYSVTIDPSGSPLDVKPPVLTVALPRNKAILGTSPVTVSGTAKDAGTPKTGVALVLYSLNGAPVQLATTANKFTNWTASVTLQPGWNTFVAQALDYRGNASTIVSNLYFYGAIANSIGSYNGLFYETNSSGNPAINRTSAGAVINLKPTFSRTYSGKLLMGGASYTLKGLFLLNGDAVTNVSRGNLPPLTVAMHIDWSGSSKQITGVVSCPAEGWSAPLTADLAVYGTANPYTPRRYTMSIAPASDAPTNSPGGYGYGLIYINASGKINLNGALADSTSISPIIPISRDGRWPLYVDLYKHQGLLEGWIDFSSGAPSGNITWIKAAHPVGVTLTTYPAGFSNVVNVFGSAYVPVAPAVTLANNQLEITDGSGLNLPLTFDTTVTALNQLSKLPGTTNKMTGSINTSTGLLSVSFQPTGLGNAQVTAKGVVLQSSNAAYGAFIGRDDGTGKTNTDAIYLH
ncbi:MAG: hypothetical protein JWO95_2652, partial [Verrucomicrobiales bacterium]|nr:hypothetical protein [Verrucomicrobiales bacterium]